MYDFKYHGEYIHDYFRDYWRKNPEAKEYAVRIECGADEVHEPDLTGIAHALVGLDSSRAQFERSYINKCFTILRVGPKEQAVFPDQLAPGQYLCVYRHDFSWSFYILTPDFVRSMVSPTVLKDRCKIRRDFPELFTEDE